MLPHSMERHIPTIQCGTTRRDGEAEQDMTPLYGTMRLYCTEHNGAMRQDSTGPDATMRHYVTRQYLEARCSMTKQGGLIKLNVTEHCGFTQLRTTKLALTLRRTLMTPDDAAEHDRTLLYGVAVQDVTPSNYGILHTTATENGRESLQVSCQHSRLMGLLLTHLSPPYSAIRRQHDKRTDYRINHQL